MNNKIDDFKPEIISIDSTSAVFQNTTITYNEASYTYNEVGGVYGGRDFIQGGKPNLFEMDRDKANIKEIINL